MNATYGTRKPALITSNDCDIFYSYSRSRSADASDFQNFKRIDSSLLLGTQYSDGDASYALDGMYNLRLPLSIFGEVGIYTVYIKPKEIVGKITDVSSLSAFDNINGVVINPADFDNPNLIPTDPNGLTGYRIEYYEVTDSMVKNGVHRLITSSNRCEPVAQDMNNYTGSGVAYMFSQYSNLFFCTVTPSAAMSFNTSSVPDIGQAGQKIAIVNTKFNPFALEIEITDHDIDTLTTMLEGDQVRNLDKGLITTFNSEGNIYHQAMYANVTNTSEGIHHDIKISNGTTVDFGEKSNYDRIRNAI